MPVKLLIFLSAALFLIFLPTLFMISPVINYFDPIRPPIHNIEELVDKNLTKTKNVVKNNDPLLILHWNMAYDRYIFDSEDFKKCPLKCQVTTDRQRAYEADSIMFYSMHFGKIWIFEYFHNCN
jgi:hypothetical protein